MRLSDAYIAWQPRWSGGDGTKVTVLCRDARGALPVPRDYSWVPAGEWIGGTPCRTATERLAVLFINFHTLTVRDGIDPQVAHKALLAVDEYRWAISPDTTGAEDPPEPTPA